MKQKRPFLWCSIGYICLGHKIKGGFLFGGVSPPALRLTLQCVKDWGSCIRVRGYDTLVSFCLNSALEVGPRGKQSSFLVRLGDKRVKLSGHRSCIMCRKARFRVKDMVLSALAVSQKAIDLRR